MADPRAEQSKSTVLQFNFQKMPKAKEKTAKVLTIRSKRYKKSTKSLTNTHDEIARETF